jgi:hypothetical protein
VNVVAQLTGAREAQHRRSIDVVINASAHVCMKL